MISIAAFLFACADVHKPGDDTGSYVTDTPDFVGMDFILESSEGYQPISERVYLNFSDMNGDEIEFSFYAACNDMGGSFLFEDGVMSVQELWTTDMGCDPELMEEDDWFANFWNSGVSLVLDGDLLTASDGTNTFYFRDSEVVTPDLPLVGNLWVIDTFIDGDAAAAYDLGSEPTIQFADDGVFSLYTGCNDGGGDYTLNGSTISITMGDLTEAECMDEGGQMAEQHILEVLNGELELEIDASRIQLMNGAKGISGTAQ